MNTPLSAASHIPIPPSFSDFKFSVIGHNEPPALLTRLSMGGGMPHLAESSHSHPHSQTPEPKLQLLYPSRSTTPWLPGNTSEPQPSSQQRHERAGYSTEPSLGDLYIPMDITEERKPIMRPETPTTSLESNHSRDGNFALLDSAAHVQEDNLISSTSTLNHQPTTAIHSTSHQPTLTSAQTSSAPSQPTNVVEENRLSTINKELQVLELAYERALITCQKTGHNLHLAKEAVHSAQEASDAANATLVVIATAREHRLRMRDANLKPLPVSGSSSLPVNVASLEGPSGPASSTNLQSSAPSRRSDAIFHQINLNRHLIGNLSTFSEERHRLRAPELDMAELEKEATAAQRAWLSLSSYRGDAPSTSTAPPVTQHRLGRPSQGLTTGISNEPTKTNNDKFNFNEKHHIRPGGLPHQPNDPASTQRPALVSSHSPVDRHAYQPTVVPPLQVIQGTPNVNVPLTTGNESLLSKRPVDVVVIDDVDDDETKTPEGERSISIPSSTEEDLASSMKVVQKEIKEERSVSPLNPQTLSSNKQVSRSSSTGLSHAHSSSSHDSTSRPAVIPTLSAQGDDKIDTRTNLQTVSLSRHVSRSLSTGFTQASQSPKLDNTAVRSPLSANGTDKPTTPWIQSSSSVISRSSSNGITPAPSPPIINSNPLRSIAASAIPTKGNDKPDASTKYQNQNSTTTSYPNYNADVPTTSQRLPPGNLALLQRMQTMPTISAPQSPTQAQPPKISPPSPTVLGKRTYGGEPSTVTRSPGSTLPAKRPNLGNPPPAESPSLGSRIAQIPVESDYSPPPPIRFPPKQQQQQHSPPPPRDPPTRPPSGPRFNQKEPVREPYYPKKSYDSYVPSNTTTTRGDSYYNRSKAPSPRTEYDSPPATRHGNPSTRGRGGEMRLGQHRVTSPDNYSHPWRGKNTSRAYSPVSDRRGPKALPLAQRLRDP